MIDLKNPDIAQKVTGDIEEYLFRMNDHLPYPDVEVVAAVKRLANFIGYKRKPKVMWLADATKKNIAPPKNMTEEERGLMTTNYFRGMGRLEHELWEVQNEVGDALFGYYAKEENKAPEDIRKLINNAELSWGRRRLDELINAEGVVREQAYRVLGPIPDRFTQYWYDMPTQYYVKSADRIRLLGRFVKAMLLGEYFIKDKRKKIFHMLHAARVIHQSLYSILAYNNKLILVERPRLYTNNRGLHREGGYAIEFPKLKKGVYSRNNVRVTRELVMTPAEELSTELITKTRNAEIRREAVDKIGIDRVLKELATEVIDSSEDGVYQVVNLSLGDTDWRGEPRFRPFLKMLNPSTGDYHIEGIPPHIRTVKAALSFRNGTDEAPQALT